MYFVDVHMILLFIADCTMDPIIIKSTCLQSFDGYLLKRLDMLHIQHTIKNCWLTVDLGYLTVSAPLLFLVLFIDRYATPHFASNAVSFSWFYPSVSWTK